MKTLRIAFVWILTLILVLMLATAFIVNVARAYLVDYRT